MSTFVDPCNVLKVFLGVITTFTVQSVKIWIKKESKKTVFHDNSLSAWHGQPRMKHRTSHRQQFWVVTLTEFSNMANDRYYFHQTLFHTIIFYGLTNISSKSLVESKDLKWRCMMKYLPKILHNTEAKAYRSRTRYFKPDNNLERTPVQICKN